MMDQPVLDSTEIPNPQVITALSEAKQPSTLLPDISRVCSRCKASLGKDWLFCGVCGLRSKLQGKSSSGISATTKAPKTSTKNPTKGTKLPIEEPVQKDLTLLPAPLIAGLNTVLKALEDGGVLREAQDELTRKEMLVTALELESAMQIEDAYIKLNTEDKIKKIPGFDFDDPRISNLPRDSVNSTIPVGDYGFVYGSNMLPAIALPRVQRKSSAVSSSISSSNKGSTRKTQTTNKHHAIAPDVAPAVAGYLDDVGSVASYYQEYLERERQLAGLRRVIVDERERALAEGAVNPTFGGATLDEDARHRQHGEYLRQQQALLGEEVDDVGGTGGDYSAGRGSFIVNGLSQSRLPAVYDDLAEEEEEDKEESDVMASAQGQGLFWGTLKQRGRFFLPRDGIDVGYVLDVQKDVIDARPLVGLGKNKNSNKTDGNDEVYGESEADDGSADGDGDIGALSWQQVLLEAEQLKALAEPMLWSQTIRPKLMQGEGLEGFLDDRPLSRPLTPEVTSDDEDEKFEQAMLAMQKAQEEKKAAEAAANAPKATMMEDKLSSSAGSEMEMLQAEGSGSSTSPPPQVGSQSRPQSKETSITSPDATHDDDIHEVDHVDPHAAAERAAKLKAEKKARIARARRKLAFETLFQQVQEQGKPKPKRFKPKTKRPEEMDEVELREYELKKAIALADGAALENDDDDDNSTLPDEPLPIKTSLPAFRAYSIIARMYKHSIAVLRAAVAQAEYRAVDEILPPPRSGKPMPFQLFNSKLAIVREALLQAPGVDQQAHIEYEAFSVKISKARADAATEVALALQGLTSLHATYNKRFSEVVAEASDPQQLSRLAKLRAKADDDLLIKGRELQELQAREAALVQDLRAQEFVTIQTVQKWRPIHAEWLGKARWAQRSLYAVLESCAAKVIQRTAKRKLLFMFWGEPAEPWSDPIAEKLKHKKKVVYKERPW